MRQSPTQHRPTILTLTLWACLAAPPLVLAQDAPEAAPAEPRWKGSVGLSFLSTSGNSDTQSLGSEAAFERVPDPWGFHIGANFSRVEENGEKTAERYYAQFRAERKLGERWSLFGGLSGERDRFAGFDLRAVVELGGSLRVLHGPKHELSFDGGLTWTSEDLSAGGSKDSPGGLLAADYAWQITKSAQWTDRLEYYPSFEDSDDWRLTYKAGLAADLTRRLALKVGYELRYDHQPVAGFEDTDTTFNTSLVVRFPPG